MLCQLTVQMCCAVSAVKRLSVISAPACHGGHITEDLNGIGCVTLGVHRKFLVACSASAGKVRTDDVTHLHVRVFLPLTDTATGLREENADLSYGVLLGRCKAQ